VLTPRRHRDTFPTRRSSDLAKLLYVIILLIMQYRRPSVAYRYSSRHTHAQEAINLDFRAACTSANWQTLCIVCCVVRTERARRGDRKSTRLNSSHVSISYAV